MRGSIHRRGNRAGTVLGVAAVGAAHVAAAILVLAARAAPHELDLVLAAHTLRLLPDAIVKRPARALRQPFGHARSDGFTGHANLVPDDLPRCRVAEIVMADGQAVMADDTTPRAGDAELDRAALHAVWSGDSRYKRPVPRCEELTLAPDLGGCAPRSFVTART